MAKVHHANYIDTIIELSETGRQRKVLHLNTGNAVMTGETLRLEGNDLVNFGTCGYLGLEMDDRVKESAISYTERFGTQFSVSRAFLTSTPNRELEDLLMQMYKHPVLTFSSTSTAHLSVIPSVVRSGDAIILDQQVHMSVQTACQLMLAKGIPVEMIRHSRMDMLEQKIQELGNRYKRIWYMIDGVYSMYGDMAPVAELKQLMDKYKQLHVYADDAHGISWYGFNGCGYIYHEMGMHPRMILTATLAKGFGTTGGLTVFPTDEFFRQVRDFGGPFAYSHPLAPPILGAAIASAHIHMSPEIYMMQHELSQNVKFCNYLLDEHDLPVLSDPRTPIFFVGMGKPKTGYNMVERLYKEGFYVNIGIFPTVPVKNTGLRFTITRHQSKEQIKGLIDAIAYHFPRVLEQESTSENEVRRAFRMPLKQESLLSDLLRKENSGLIVEHATDINDLNAKEWDSLLGNNGAFTAEAMRFAQDAFSGNPELGSNYSFHYYIIRDRNSKPLAATFFTVGIYKDDMLAAASVSRRIEETRKTDPLYLTSKTIAMGSLFSEGIYLYTDRNHPEWQQGVRVLLNEVQKLQEKTSASNILLRDFEADDEVLKNIFIEEGFVPVVLPDAWTVEEKLWDGDEFYLNKLTHKKRYHVKKTIMKYQHHFEVEVKTSITEDEMQHFHKMYMAVKNNNFGINYFSYPVKLFRELSKHPNWEFVVLRLKDVPGKPIVGMSVGYIGEPFYTSIIVGMDYDYNRDYNVYRQLMYWTIRRGGELNKETIRLGFTADLEKLKLGAKKQPRLGFMQAKDNYHFELIESMATPDDTKC